MHDLMATVKARTANRFRLKASSDPYMAQPEHDPASQALALSDPYMVQPEHGLSESEKPSKDAKWSKSAEISAVLVRKALEKASGRSRSPAAPEVIPTKSMPMWMKMQLKAAAPAPPPPSMQRFLSRLELRWRIFLRWHLLSLW